MNFNKKEIRFRFAPSPTGFVHIGSLWGALFAYLSAKSLGGKLILRIEDTDQKRLVDGAVNNLIDVLNWVGIKFDESPKTGGPFEPYIQSERSDIYKKKIEELLEKKACYRCFCTPERLNQMRKEQEMKKLPPRYDRLCRDLSQEEIDNKLKNNERFVIRQKIPIEGEIIVYDELRGDIKFSFSDLDDHILMKSSGLPTYHFASVVDDHLMKISHVTRGQEWIPSFPKNILLYKSFGWEAPKFIHLPVILDKAGGKLSKRKGNVAVEDYIKDGYLPEALINFCVLMGWHPKDDKEELSFDEILKKFNIKNIGISSPVFDIEKLNYFNGLYIRKKNISELTGILLPYLDVYIEKINSKEFRNKINNKIVNHDFIKNIVSLEQERIKKLSDITSLVRFFFEDDLNYDSDLLIWKKTEKIEIKNNLEKILVILEEENDFSKENLEKKIINYIKDNDYKVGNFLWPLRVSLSGEEKSPGPFEIAWVLGKDESIKRVENAISKLK